MPRQCRLTAGWMLLVCLSVAGPAAAQPVQDDLRKLFEFGTDRTTSGQQAARKYWQALRTQQPDPRIDYAYALVLAEQRQFPPALKVLEHVLQGQDDDPAIHRTKIWIEIQSRQYEAALESMLRLAEKFPQAAADRPDAKAWRDAADFLGCMTGFLAGPLSGQVDQQLLGEHEQQILQAIGPGQREHFDAGRSSVIAHYDQLVLDLERLEREFQSEEEKRIESHQKNLSHEQDRVNEAKQAVLDKSQSLIGERGELLDVERQLASARAAYAKVEEIAKTLNSRLEYLKLEQDLLEQEIDVDGMTRAEANRRVSGRNLTQSLNYEKQVAVGRQLLQANVQLRRIALRGQQLLARRNALVARHQLETAKLQKTARQIVHTQKRIEFDRPDTRPSSQNPKILALRRQLDSLSTYDPLPLLPERDRILAALAEKP